MRNVRLSEILFSYRSISTNATFFMDVEYTPFTMYYQLRIFGLCGLYIPIGEIRQRIDGPDVQNWMRGAPCALRYVREFGQVF